MSIQEALMEKHKQYSCYEFISRVFQGFASNFGGNFLSRGVAKSHQMTICLGRRRPPASATSMGIKSTQIQA